jgi:hypothetical protein
MPFDLKLSLSVSSDPISHTLALQKELNPMSWIDDEANRAKAIDDTKAERDELYRTQAPGLWDGLKHYLKRDIETINKNQYLVDSAWWKAVAFRGR